MASARWGANSGSREGTQNGRPRRVHSMLNSIGSEPITSTCCLSTRLVRQRTLVGAKYVIRAAGAALAFLGGVLKLVTSGGIAGSSAELGPT